MSAVGVGVAVIVPAADHAPLRLSGSHHVPHR
jgi:hypothetical protein